MAATLYTRYRGETITIGVADTGAQPGGEALIASSLRPIAAGRSAPVSTASDAASMAIAYRPANVSFPVGWLLTLDAADCTGLPSGNYLIDLKITDGTGAVTIMNPAIVMLAEPATL
ncbi:MAG: hypothetical protein M3N34_03570 [Pseudomonadota bacterium]|nr:hypothetical protein [Pseudomonadota bacterium]